MSRQTTRVLVLWGLLVWLAVAVAIRLLGHVLLAPANRFLVFGFFLAVIPLMAMVTYPVYWRLSIPSNERVIAAAVMSIPGMFLDVALVMNAPQLFPQMGSGAVRNFGAILLYGYAIVLMTGFVPVPESGERE